MLDFIKKMWDAIPDGVRKVIINIVMVGAYSFVFVFLNSLTTDWQISIAMTAGFRAALIAIVQILEAPKPVTTKAKKGTAAAPVRQQLSQHL